MQLLMQVLNKEPNVEGTLNPVKMDPALSGETTPDFSELVIQADITVENEATISIDVPPTQSAVTEDGGNVELVDLQSRRHPTVPIEFAERLAPIDDGVARMDFEPDVDRPLSGAKVEGLPVVAVEKPLPTPANESVRIDVKKSADETIDTQVLPKGRDARIAATQTVVSNIANERAKIGSDAPQPQQGVTARSNEPETTAKPVPSERLVALPSANADTAERAQTIAVVSVTRPSDTRVSEITNEQLSARPTTPVDSTQHKTPVSLVAAMDAMPRPNKAPLINRAERVTQDVQLQSVPVVSEPASKAPLPTPILQSSEKPARPESDRPSRRDIRSDTAVRTITANAPSDPSQTIQVTAMVSAGQMTKEISAGREARPLKEDALPPMGVTESSEVRRSAESAAMRVEPVTRSVITQLVQAARATPDGMVEVRLSPEELGRVRLSMTTMENGMNVMVMTERPETLDLIRRNIELLAADLEGQGFQNLNFSFNGEGAHDDPNEPTTRNGKSEDADLRSVFEGHAEMRQPIADGRVDIRV